MVKVAVNKEHGGFSISQEVVDILKRKGVKCQFYEGEISSFFNPKEYGYHIRNETFFLDKSLPYDAHRAFPPLIEAIEEAKDPNGKFAKIEIIDIPDDIEWYIDDYDGYETIRESHKTW